MSIKMISEGSYDIEDWSNDDEISPLPSQISTLWKTQTESWNPVIKMEFTV